MSFKLHDLEFICDFIKFHCKLNFWVDFFQEILLRMQNSKKYKHIIRIH